MYHDKISFWHVEKEAENLIIYTHYDTETNFREIVKCCG